jgi:hypothetical protein
MRKAHPSRGGLRICRRGAPRRVTSQQQETDMQPCYEIRYEPLSGRGPELVFPCDAQGRVELDALSDRARNNYLYARAVVGREYAAPAVLPCDLH